MTVTNGDALTILRTLPDQQFHCCVTSPPYWGLRDYGTAQWSGGEPNCDHLKVLPGSGLGRSTPQGGQKTNGHQQEGFKDTCRKCGAVRIDQQLGLERTPEEYVSRMVDLFREVRRVLRDDGTLWLNLGDCYGRDEAKGQHKPGDSGKQDYIIKRGNGRIANQVNLTECSLKPKDLVGMPWRVAFALQADGWYLRSDIIWHKPNPMPESVTDRPTKAHEYIFLMSKSEKYFYNAEAIAEKASPDTHARYGRGRSDNHKYADGGPGRQTIATNKPGSRFYKKPAGWNTGPGDHRDLTGRYAPGVNPKCAEPGSGIKQNSSFSAAVKDVLDYRNKRSVWTINTQAYPEAHFATFPEDLVRPCILAGCPPGGIVLEPFAGSGTTLAVARQLGCDAYGIELNPKYIPLIEKRLAQEVLPLETPETAVTSEGLQVSIFEETA